MANKEEVGIIVDVLRSRLGTGAMTEREELFAKGLVSFFDYKGRLSEKQLLGATRLAVRLICERDAAFSL